MPRRHPSLSVAFYLVVVLLACAHLLTAAAAPPDARTERTWRAKCASCHGDDGKGATEQGKKMAIRDMSSAAWQKELTDEKIKSAISNGLKTERDGKKQEMEPFKDKLRPEQIDALIGYVRSLGK